MKSFSNTQMTKLAKEFAPKGGGLIEQSKKIPFKYEQRSASRDEETSSLKSLNAAHKTCLARAAHAPAKWTEGKENKKHRWRQIFFDYMKGNAQRIGEKKRARFSTLQSKKHNSKNKTNTHKTKKKTCHRTCCFISPTPPRQDTLSRSFTLSLSPFVPSRQRRCDVTESRGVINTFSITTHFFMQIQQTN